MPDRDFQFIYDNYDGMNGAMSLENIQQTNQFLDFRAKMWYLYDIITESYGSKVSYTWILFFFKNMTVVKVQSLAEKSNDYALDQPLAKVTWMSPDSLPSIGVPHWSGLRITEEQADLMKVLRENGIDVYICTASLEDVVAVFAGNPKYSYHVPRENVIGMRLEKINNVYQDTYLQDWPLVFEHGKTIAIDKLLVNQYGYGPLLVSGDSGGDYHMMTEFPDTKCVILVNRLKKGLIGNLCKQAVDTMGTQHPKFILQGRDENTGLWLPTEKMIEMGKITEKLLP